MSAPPHPITTSDWLARSPYHLDDILVLAEYEEHLRQRLEGAAREDQRQREEALKVREESGKMWRELMAALNAGEVYANASGRSEEDKARHRGRMAAFTRRSQRMMARLEAIEGRLRRNRIRAVRLHSQIRQVEKLAVSLGLPL